MARGQWFDPESNELMFSKFVTQMDSWQQAMADGAIDASEVEKQAEQVQGMLRALEPKLSDELHQEITNIFYELAVFYGMVQMYESALEEGGAA